MASYVASKYVIPKHKVVLDKPTGNIHHCGHMIKGSIQISKLAWTKHFVQFCPNKS